MIIAVGIDMVEIARVERLLASKGEHALRKLFTDAERAYATSRPRPALHLAARVAAKEAAYKALRGTHSGASDRVAGARGGAGGGWLSVAAAAWWGGASRHRDWG